MGIRGVDELVAVLPSSASEPARAVAQGLADLSCLRYSALAPEDVQALGELWERFTAQVTSGRLAVLPSSASEPARAVAQGLADLSCLRHSALAPEDVRALGELSERFTAKVASARLGVLAAVDARDDVIPKARVGDAGAVFAHHALGQRRGSARRDAHWAGLLRPEVGDLPAVGAAFAAGDVSAAHIEVAVRTHRDLGSAAREALVECEIPDTDTDADAGAQPGGREG